MTSNSEIFTTTTFGTGSSLTAEEMTNKTRTTQESFLSQSANTNLGSGAPTVPTNQRIAKDK
jgi:hypothetical protein